MEVIKFNLKKTYGHFKVLNATNGGPLYKRHAQDQYRSNYADYKAARIPYSRNHDSNAHGPYGDLCTAAVTEICSVTYTGAAFGTEHRDLLL